MAIQQAVLWILDQRTVENLAGILGPAGRGAPSDGGAHGAARRPGARTGAVGYGEDGREDRPPGGREGGRAGAAHWRARGAGGEASELRSQCKHTPRAGALWVAAAPEGRGIRGGRQCAGEGGSSQNAHLFLTHRCRDHGRGERWGQGGVRQTWKTVHEKMSTWEVCARASTTSEAGFC